MWSIPTVSLYLLIRLFNILFTFIIILIYCWWKASLILLSIDHCFYILIANTEVKISHLLTLIPVNKCHNKTKWHKLLHLEPILTNYGSFYLCHKSLSDDILPLVWLLFCNMNLWSQFLNRCETGLVTVRMSDVAYCGPNNAQQVCVNAQTHGKIDGFGAPILLHTLVRLNKLNQCLIWMWIFL